ncbi:MAG: hypothetical protein PHV34_08365 [Verrucomicrobiae bacterium]|nr:hypothetical protein [Verrucomicrobiae bacterium]
MATITQIAASTSRLMGYQEVQQTSEAIKRKGTGNTEAGFTITGTSTQAGSSEGTSDLRIAMRTAGQNQNRYALTGEGAAEVEGNIKGNLKEMAELVMKNGTGSLADETRSDLQNQAWNLRDQINGRLNSSKYTQYSLRDSQENTGQTRGAETLALDSNAAIAAEKKADQKAKESILVRQDNQSFSNKVEAEASAQTETSGMGAGVFSVNNNLDLTTEEGQIRAFKTIDSTTSAAAPDREQIVKEEKVVDQQAATLTPQTPNVPARGTAAGSATNPTPSSKSAATTTKDSVETAQNSQFLSHQLLAQSSVALAVQGNINQKNLVSLFA